MDGWLGMASYKQLPPRIMCEAFDACWSHCPVTQQLTTAASIRKSSVFMVPRTHAQAFGSWDFHQTTVFWNAVNLLSGAWHAGRI